MWFPPPRPRRTGAAAPVVAAGDGAAGLADLVDGVARGDRAALAVLYRRESGAVYRYALALSGNPAWAADATQEAFVAFALRPQGFDPARGPLAAYLAGVARHALLATWRGDRPAGAPADVDDDGDDAAPEAAAESPEAMLVRARSVQALWAAVRRLPWPQREALVLVDLQERSYAEAARIAGAEINTLRTRLHRARARLAVLLCAADDALGPTR